MNTIQVGSTHFYVGETIQTALASLKYSIDDNVLTIWHTNVSEELKGQGVGQALVATVVTYARDHQLKVYPVCTYAKAQFDKHPDYLDVLVK